MTTNTQRFFAVLPPYATLTSGFRDLLASLQCTTVFAASDAHRIESGAGDAFQLGADIVDFMPAELGAPGLVRCTPEQWAFAKQRLGERVINPQAFIEGVFATQEAVDHGCVPAALARFERKRLQSGDSLKTVLQHSVNEAPAPPSPTPAPSAPAEAQIQTQAQAQAPVSAAPSIIDGQTAIAIVGLGAIMPDANTTAKFWENILAGHNAITEVPADRWNPEIYWNADRSAPDKTYSKIGGFVKDFQFNRKLFRLPPAVVAKTDPSQLTCLEAVRQAMEDAGYDQKEFDRNRCGVVLGNSLGGDLRDATNLRIQYAEIEAKLRTTLLEASLGNLQEADIETLLEKVGKSVLDDLPPISEDSMPGELPNVISGRVAAAFDLRGPNFVVDAACASSLAAIETAILGLQAKQYDMCVCGGVDRGMGPPSYVKFCKIGALSADGSRPFDAGANGFVMGEGAGILILKRLADAISDGDKVYAVIRGVGSSSDGKGKGITAPNPRGQVLAVKRAYQNAGIRPKTVSLFEAHGTSTPVGDVTELGSLLEGLKMDDGPWATEHVGLGSVKSMIGHLKSAAGAASLVKIAMALKHKVLPPSINVNQLNPAIKLSGTPISVQHELTPWDVPTGVPRRAGISAFGFGGTNFHVVLEEYDPSRTGDSKSWNGLNMTSNAPMGGLLTFAAGTYAELTAKVETFGADYATQGIELAKQRASEDLKALSRSDEFRLAISWKDADELDLRLAKAIKALGRKKGWKVLANQGVFFTEQQEGGKLGMLFPGQGSQYLNMAKTLAERFSVVKDTFDEADAVMTPILGRKLTDIVAPDLTNLEESEAFLALSQTEVTQPAVLMVDVAMYRLFKSLGLEADLVAGHSLGEYGACVAAGVMSFSDALTTVAARGSEMAKATPMNGDPGLMVGVAASVETVEKVLGEIDGYVVCANKNCPAQTIIAGSTEPAKDAIKAFAKLEIDTVVLPVSHAFHSKVVAAASIPLRNHLGTISISTPKTPILTNVTGDFYPSSPGAEDEIRDLLAQQVAAPVEYIELIERMYANGVRTFVEVGPKRAQTSFVKSILEGRPHIATHSNHPKRGDLGSFFDAMALLWVNGAWEGTQEAVATPQATPIETIMVESSTPTLNRESVLAHMTQILCDKTGYDADEIEPDFELEADLGIDTVKQAEIMSSVRDYYGFAKDDDFRLAEYPTLDRLTDYVLEKSPAQAATAPAAHQVSSPVAPASTPTTAPTAPAPPVATAQLDIGGVQDKIIEILCVKTGYDADEIEVDFELEADLGIDTVKQAEIMSSVREIYALTKDDDFRLAQYPTLAHLARYVVERAAPVAASPVAIVAPTPAPAAPASTPVAVITQAPALVRGDVLTAIVEVLCAKTGYDADEIEPEFELEADLGIDTVKQAEIMSTVRELYALAKDDDFRLSAYPTLNALTDYVIQMAPSAAPAATHAATPAVTPAVTHAAPAATAVAPPAPEVYTPRAPQAQAPVLSASITGCALGLPGDKSVFEEDAIDRLLNGENMIGAVATETKERIVGKHITRLVKLQGGGGEMKEVTKTDEVIKLAGTKGDFDIAEWDLPDRVTAGLDVTSKMAVAAGLLALKDAGLPLVPRYRTTRNGKQVTIGWQLPTGLADKTGVIFASAFAGIDYVASEVDRSNTQEDYEFDHRFLLKTLGMANARFAELIGARGPNLRMNNACSSTTAALGIAEDWIRLGRCERVVVLAADNASGEELLEWVGSGFLASGAASTEANVEDAALPFDRRRDGMLIGMGAVALVVEAGGLAEARGMDPLADLLGTRFANSALHPMRLDVDHIASEVGSFVADLEARHGFDRQKIAAETVFVSHETYTPARGGSAAAEIESIRRTFGDAASDIVIANTKGFTGHAMGAGIEDVVAVSALNRQKLPPIANFKEPDPELGDLRLSEGGDCKLGYALRLAAGFGSQLALAMFKFRTDQLDRVVDGERYDRWLQDVSGFDAPRIAVEHRTLRLRNDGVTKTAAPVAVAAESAVVQTPKPPVDPAVFAPRAVVARAGRAVRVDATALTQHFGGKRIAIAAGPAMIADMFRLALEGCGAEVHVFKGDRDPTDSDLTHCDFDDSASLVAHIGNEMFDGFVNLLGFGRDGETSVDVERAAVHTFNLCKTIQASLSNGFFVSVTGMGGRLGLDRSEGPLLSCGAVGGFTKGLSREYQDSLVRHIDIPRESLDKTAVLQVLAEMLIDDGSAEVGLVAGVRYTADTLPLAELSPQKTMMPKAKELVIVTGGAKGITAEVVKNLASSGANFALVGRTQLTHENPLGIDFDAEKKRIKAELKAKGGRVTPMMVESALRGLRSQADIVRSIEAIKQAGAHDVRYFDCDLADGVAVATMVKSIKKWKKKVVGVVHGAGIEISRLLPEKELSEFSRVFNAKAKGAICLWEALESDKLRFFVNFGSVAGRFGNMGQVDYSAANDTLNKLTARINSTKHTRAITIDWTAWDEVGMATHGSMKTILEARGVEMLPPDVGAPIVRQLLEAGQIGEFLVAGALGDMAQEPAHREAAAPFVDRVVQQDKNRVIIERTFSLSLDRFMRDHVYEGNAIVPGVMGLEFMARATSLLGHPIDSAQNVEFRRAAKLHRDEPLVMRAIAERKGDVVEARVESNRVSKTGRALNEIHHTAQFVDTSPARVGTLMHLSQALAGPSRPAIYERYFHTGVFQVLDEVPHLGEDFVVATGRVPTRALCDDVQTTEMLSLPTVREMAFQAAGLWGMYHLKRSYLPLSIGSYRQHGHVTPGALICLRCHLRDDAEEGTIGFDIEALSEDGEVLLVLQNVVMIGHRTLVASETFSTFENSIHHRRQLSAQVARALLRARGDSIDSIVNSAEREEYDRLISDRRRDEWVAARFALKSLVADQVRDGSGVHVPLSHVVIRKNEERAPSIEVDGVPFGGNVSVTHSGGVAAVVLTHDPEIFVGIDREAVEPRSDTFARDYFTESEMALAPQLPRDQRVALMWSVKEAITKALRRGLNISMSEILITQIEATESNLFRCSVELTGEAQKAFDGLLGREIEVIAEAHTGHVEALATLFAGHVASDSQTPQLTKTELVAVIALLREKNLIPDYDESSHAFLGSDLLGQ